jgi:hypothetical protein
VSWGCNPVGIESSGALPFKPFLPLAFGSGGFGVFFVRLLAGGTPFLLASEPAPAR